MAMAQEQTNENHAACLSSSINFLSIFTGIHGEETF